VAEPREKKYHPESIVDAQFSMPFGAAVAVLRGAAGLDQFTMDQVRSPQIRQFLPKVALVKDQRIEESFPREWPARVEILLTNGTRHEKFLRYPKGDPENPLSWQEMKGKFRSLAGGAFSPAQCDQILERAAAGKPAEIAGLCS
jgi:2-methylcitrate dehydratase PrpD